MAYDTTNNCTWIGSLYGLYKHPENADSLTHINSKHPLLNQRIIDIETIGQNRLAIAFKGSGLLLYNVAKDSALLVEKSDGLSSNVVRDIMKDDGHLWVGTNNGISFINLAHPKKQITQISKADGLASDEINEIHLYDSLVLVSTAEGLSYFNKNQLRFNYKPTNVIIKAVNVSSDNKNHSHEKKIRIQYPHNSIRFKFTPLLYDNSRDLTFKYRVKGLNENWKYTQKNSVFFYYLPPGDYVFEIAVRNKSGIWSKTPSKVSFYIEPALWNKTWFIILLIVAITLVVFSMLYLLLRNYRIKTAARQDITRYQQQALSNQMNPHFLFNSLNSIHRFLLENNSIHASKFLSKFARLMRLFLNNSQANEITLSKEIESIRLYLELENLRVKDKFDYHIFVDDTIDAEKVMIPSMLIQPIVENSIIHGIRYLENRRGVINISFTQNNSFMRIIVEDNGVGRQKAAEIEQKNLHQSFGNSIVSKRIELLNQLYRSFISLKYIDLYEDNLSAGTKVIIEQFPIKN